MVCLQNMINMIVSYVTCGERYQCLDMRWWKLPFYLSTTKSRKQVCTWINMSNIQSRLADKNTKPSLRNNTQLKKIGDFIEANISFLRCSSYHIHINPLLSPWKFWSRPPSEFVTRTFRTIKNKFYIYYIKRICILW